MWVQVINMYWNGKCNFTMSFYRYHSYSCDNNYLYTYTFCLYNLWPSLLLHVEMSISFTFISLWRWNYKKRRTICPKQIATVAERCVHIYCTVHTATFLTYVYIRIYHFELYLNLPHICLASQDSVIAKTKAI